MRTIRTLAAAFSLLCASLGAALGLGIVYTVEPVPGGSAPFTRFTIELTGVANLQTLSLQMPAWSPGDYQVQNHARFVRQVSAALKTGAPLSVAHPDPNTWQVDPAGADTITVQYELPNEPSGNFTENVRVTDDYAFYQGSASFLYVADHKNDPATVRVKLPSGWPAALCPLDPVASPASGSERAFAAPDYDTLADSPILAGRFATTEFTAGGAVHTVALFGWLEGADPQRFANAIRPVVEEEIRLMGGAPYKRYVFFINLGGRSGALEHGSSCRIGWSPYRDLRRLPEFVAHEFFHLWNVKRIRPAVLGPFDYINPPKTRMLWFCEGVTDYVALLSLRRAGIWNDQTYLERLGAMIEQLQQTPARKRVTAEEASERVWEERGSQGYGGLSYYLKGHLIGLCIDLKLRALTNGAASMDRLMRDLLRRYGPPKPGYPEDGIRKALIEAGGESMGPFYDRLCRSTDELPFDECLQAVGLRLADPSAEDWRIVPAPNAPPSAARLRRDWLTGSTTSGLAPAQWRAVSDRTARPAQPRHAAVAAAVCPVGLPG